MPTDKLKVCMVAAEAHPYSKVGGLGDVVSALSSALLEEEIEVRVFTPFYAHVGRFPLEKRGELNQIWMGARRCEGAFYVDSSESTFVNYFIGNEEFFNRAGIYHCPGSGEEYLDNFERFNFLSLASLQTLNQMEWKPDVFHCHDWHAALLPAYLKLGQVSGFLQNTSTLFTIHNLAYQGIFAREKFFLTGLAEDSFYPASAFEHSGKLNMMKAGICYASLINTVSPQYSREIQTQEFGCGLDEVLRERRNDLYGVLNGIDTRVWDPQSDPLIFADFSADDISGKGINKTRLQQLSGLAEQDVPLIGIISRLADQKGIDLFLAIKDELDRMDCQWVILGTGSKTYEDELERFARRNPHSFSVHLEFNDQLAHRIEAGSDILLMPSRYEPCGLNQMYSMRYGTIPVVRHTGGLADTVQEFDPETRSGNGFKFYDYRPEALLEGIQKAVKTWKDKDLWRQLVHNAMSTDFSWRRSALQYIDLYQKAVSLKSPSRPR
ncbi:glycogen synthase GlgA [Acidobacteria bacterium AH-259-L09]|nr:glycogen synthase GlgA [Acidobacteria bacterium AH-259-L09]